MQYIYFNICSYIFHGYLFLLFLIDLKFNIVYLGHLTLQQGVIYFNYLDHFYMNQLTNCYLVYPASKSSMTIRHCFRHADLVSCPSFFYIFSNICFLKKPHHFLHFTAFSQQCHMSHQIMYFFLLSLHLGSLVGYVLLLVSGFCMLVVHFLTSNIRGLIQCVQSISCSV